MARVKIAIIGGGSAYCPLFLSAFLDLAPTFSGSQIVLMDIDPDHLAIIHRLGQRMAQALGVDIQILKTTDQRAAIEGADFVLSSFRPGRLEARALDERIPLKYGIIGQETVGPGGFFMALRSVWATQGIVSDMEELASKAFLINYTNPTNIVTESVLHHSPIRAIGLCDQAQGDKRRIANALSLEVSRLHYEACGLNHATWSTRFTIDGQNGMPLLLEKAPSVLTDPDVPPPVRRMFKLAQWFGRIPNRYWQYYFFHDEMLEEDRKSKFCRAEEIMAELPGYFAHFEEESGKPHPNPVKMRGGSRAFGDFAVEVMKAIVEDTNDMFMLNVLNQGAIPGFDDDRVVEVPCFVNHKGPQPLPQEPLPHEGLGRIKMLAEYQALAAKVAWEGRRKDAIRALVANPLVLTLAKAQALYDEMSRAHALYLPKSLVEES